MIKRMIIFIFNLMWSENQQVSSQELKMLNQKFGKYLKIEENPHCIKIGYYPFRGKAQVCRLISQYLHIPYQDLFFIQNTWKDYKNTKEQQWIFYQLPFLKDTNGFVVTETIPICLYLIEKSGNTALLGKTIKDQIVIQQFIWSWDMFGCVMGEICKKQMSNEDEQQHKKEMWKKIIPKFMEYQIKAQQNNFYIGYLTIIDFFLSEILFLLNGMFPNSVEKLPKLVTIQKKVQQIAEISEYEHSSRAIKEYCPKKFFTEFHKYMASTIKHKCFLKCIFS